MAKVNKVALAKNVNISWISIKIILTSNHLFHNFHHMRQQSWGHIVGPNVILL